MIILELVLIGISLSMDAFAISICKGLEMRSSRLKTAIIVGLFFGIAQAVMPLLGYYLGTAFASLITNYDHWVAFGLLVLIGGKMIYDGFHDKDSNPTGVACKDKLDYKQLFIMAIATSIDALAVGISLAFDQTNIWLAISIIGVVTFIICVVGVLLGQKIGSKFQNKAQIVGGIVLCLVGLKILLEHLGVIHF